MKKGWSNGVMEHKELTIDNHSDGDRVMGLKSRE